MTKRYQRGNQEGTNQWRTDNVPSWLPLWYLFVIVLSVLLWFVSSWLPLWYLLVIVLSVLIWFVPSWLPLWYLLVIVGTNQRSTDNTMTKRYQRGNQAVTNQRSTDNTMTKRYQRGNQEGTNQRSD
jgi:energy-coupling factor transporter transmembrane protein EcfT